MPKSIFFIQNEELRFAKNNGHQILISKPEVTAFFAYKQYFFKIFLKNEKPPDGLHSQSGGKDNFKIL